MPQSGSRASCYWGRPPIERTVREGQTLIRRWGRALAAGLVVSALGGCVAAPPRQPAAPAASVPARLRVRTRGTIVSVPLEDYVLGSALAEVAPVGETPATVERIYEVQAVLARSYAASHLGRHRAEGFDLCDTTHCQLYEPGRIRTSRFAAVAAEAVRRTAGLVITYQGRLADTVFSADAGGYTAAANTVWGGAPIPYLIARPDVRTARPWTWRRSVTADQLRSALDRDPRTDIGGHLDRIEVRQRDAGGRAVVVALLGDHSHLVRGEVVRDVINAHLGDAGLDSTLFSVKQAGRTYTFEGRGHGHGVGLSQAGAAARARRGDSLQAILTYYFPGTTLTRAR